MEKSSDENSLVPKYLQEVDLTGEYKELISTLPLEKGWIKTPFRQYQGCWIGSRTLQNVLSCQRHFQALDTDILLVTVPKSGTTWLKALTFALLNRNKYPNIHLNHPLLSSNPHDLVPFFEHDLYINKEILPNLNSLSHPRLFCTHLPYDLLPKSVKESRCKIVYLCRDPKDNFVSFWHFINNLRPQSMEKLALDELFESFCRGVSPFGPFWEHILGYWKESLMERSNKVMFLRFEEMKIKPNFYLKKLAEFMESPFSKEEESKGVVDDILNLCSFEKLSELKVNKVGKVATGVENKYFFRRGHIGDWKNLLTTEMVEQLNTIIEKELVKHGLNF
ncbi:cytosolic sulfotransferase 5-like [Vicia villosa]|uniref:cytosolic sulfotransferase 5-like n=1 Tax=Vicia villosa TaxID=3911 RepID=UPI00273A776A|nr:cytosolic sulfotransferase 5-like [Vicia villosa]